MLRRHDKSFYFIFQDSGQVHIRVKLRMSLTTRFIVCVAETQKSHVLQFLAGRFLVKEIRKDVCNSSSSHYSVSLCECVVW